MKKSRVLTAILVMAMLLTLLAGCGNTNSNANAATPPPADANGSGTQAAQPDDGTAQPDSDYEWPKMTLTINDYNVANSGPAIATQTACDYIEEVSGGNIKCDVYFGGTLMESTDSFAGTAEGMADITYYLYTLNSGVCPLHTVFTSYYFRQMPDMVGLFDVINNTLDSVPEFREEFMKSNLYELVSVPTAGSRMQFSDANMASQVKTPDDLKGKLIQSSGYNTPAWSNHGVSGMSMAPSEWYTNLERGVCDALTMNMPGCKDFGLVDVANSYLAFGDNGGLYHSCAGYLANLDAWNSWEPEVQQLVVEAFRKGGRLNCERDNAGQWEIWDSETEAGKNMVTIPEEEMQPWYDLGMESVDLWKVDAEKSGVDADAILKGYEAEIDKWFAENG